MRLHYELARLDIQGPVGCQLTHLNGTPLLYMEVKGHTPQDKHKGLPLGQHRSGHVSENTPELGDATLELYTKNMKACSIVPVGSMYMYSLL